MKTERFLAFRFCQTFEHEICVPCFKFFRKHSNRVHFTKQFCARMEKRKLFTLRLLWDQSAATLFEYFSFF